MYEIKVIKINGDYFYTKINGTEEDIIDYYNNFNFLCDNKENIQVKQIEITLNTNTGFMGCRQRNIIYPFTYNESAECYLY